MEKLGADRSNIKASLGPLIRQSNYEVSQDFVDQFVRENESYSRFFAPAERARTCNVRLAGLHCRAESRKAGSTSLQDLGLCTYADPDRFYSYRRSTYRAEPDYGRHINAIALTA